MAGLKQEEIKDMDSKAIDAKVQSIRVELFNIRMQKAATGAVEKPHTLKIAKKNIARLLTQKTALEKTNSKGA
jgi:large subunit ribosomal protein L29